MFCRSTLIRLRWRRDAWRSWNAWLFFLCCILYRVVVRHNLFNSLLCTALVSASCHRFKNHKHQQQQQQQQQQQHSLKFKERLRSTHRLLSPTQQRRYRPLSLKSTRFVLRVQLKREPNVSVCAFKPPLLCCDQHYGEACNNKAVTTWAREIFSKPTSFSLF